MALAASQGALRLADVQPQELDLIIVANSSPDRILPCTAAVLQQSLGSRNVGAFDLNAACSGFVYALSVAQQFLQTGVYRTVLVVGSEIYSRMLDWEDRATCVLFGDGAGAVVLQASDQPGGLMSCVLGNEGQGAEYLTAGAAKAGAIPPTQEYLAMNGQQVYKYAVRAMAQATLDALAQAGISLNELDLFVPHQANLRIINAIAQSLGLPEDRIFANLDRYGNTAAASIPIALCEAVEAGRLLPGHKVVLVAAGAGISWGAMVLEWGPVGLETKHRDSATSIA